MNKKLVFMSLMIASQLTIAASVDKNKTYKSEKNKLENTLTKSQTKTSSEAWTFAIKEISDKLDDIDSAVLTLRSKKEIINLNITRTLNGLYKISIEKNNKNNNLLANTNYNFMKFFIPPPSF